MAVDNQTILDAVNALQALINTLTTKVDSLSAIPVQDPMPIFQNPPKVLTPGNRS